MSIETVDSPVTQTAETAVNKQSIYAGDSREIYIKGRDNTNEPIIEIPMKYAKSCILSMESLMFIGESILQLKEKCILSATKIVEKKAPDLPALCSLFLHFHCDSIIFIGPIRINIHYQIQICHTFCKYILAFSFCTGK